MSCQKGCANETSDNTLFQVDLLARKKGIQRSINQSIDGPLTVLLTGGLLLFKDSALALELPPPPPFP